MLDEINKLINSPIKLRVKDHKYILESNPTIVFFSVTNLVEDQFPPFESDKIAENLVNNVPKYRGYTKKSLLQEWKNIRDTGAAVHLQLQQYIEKGKRPKLSKANSEVIVFSEKLKIAGTVDLLRQLAIQS
jgi:hypothetical protein